MKFLSIQSSAAFTTLQWGVFDMQIISTVSALLVVISLMLDAFLYQVYGYEYFAKYKHVSYGVGVGCMMFWKIEMEGGE